MACPQSADGIRVEAILGFGSGEKRALTHLSRISAAGLLGPSAGRPRWIGVIFDWDGVLLDSLGASFNVYNRIFDRIGTKKLTKDEFLELQSPNWYEFYSKVGLAVALWKRVDEEWLQLYNQERPRLHSDAERCVSSLKAAGFRLALVSNGSEIRVKRELKAFGLAASFESVLCGRNMDELKPSPVMIQRTLAVLGLGPEEAVYVGDAPVDVQASKSAGVESLAIIREPIVGRRLRAVGPDYVFDDLDGMTRFLVYRRSE